MAYRDLSEQSGGEPSAVIAERVAAARAIQSARFAKRRINCNAQMSSRHIRKFCHVDNASASLLEAAVERLGLSARAYGRVLKIARTIADLEGVEHIDVSRVSEAIQFRSLDRGKRAV